MAIDYKDLFFYLAENILHSIKIIMQTDFALILIVYQSQYHVICKKKKLYRNLECKVFHTNILPNILLYEIYQLHSLYVKNVFTIKFFIQRICSFSF